MNAQKGKKKKSGTAMWLLLSLLLIIVAGAAVAYKVFGPNTGDMRKGEYLYIPTGASYMLVLDELINGGYIDDVASFDILAKRANYPNMIKAGKFKIKKGTSNYELIRKLRSGRQEPVKLVIKAGKIKATSNFSVKLADYNISGQQVESGKVSRVAKVTVSANF